MGAPGGEERYTLYPATGDLLVVQLIVTECGLAGAAGVWDSPISFFPHPAKSDSAAKEKRQKPRRAGREWKVPLIRKAET